MSCMSVYQCISVSVCQCVSVCLFACLMSVYQCPSVRPSIRLSVRPSIRLSVRPSIRLSISVCPSVCPSDHPPSDRPTVHPFRPSIHSARHPPVRPSVRPSVHPSVRLRVCECLPVFASGVAHRQVSRRAGQGASDDADAEATLQGEDPAEASGHHVSDPAQLQGVRIVTQQPLVVTRLKALLQLRRAARRETGQFRSSTTCTVFAIIYVRLFATI